MKKNIAAAGLGHTWPESLYAVWRAVGCNNDATCRALGLCLVSFLNYFNRRTFPVWPSTQRKFRNRGWGDYELPIQEPSNAQVLETMKQLCRSPFRWLYGGLATADAQNKPSVAAQAARVAAEEPVYARLVEMHLRSDARGPAHANELACMDVKRLGIDGAITLFDSPRENTTMKA